MNNDEMIVSRAKLRALFDSISFYKHHADMMNAGYVEQAEYSREQKLCENEVLYAHYFQWTQILEGLQKMAGVLMHEES